MNWVAFALSLPAIALATWIFGFLSGWIAAKTLGYPAPFNWRIWLGPERYFNWVQEHGVKK